MIQKIKSWMSDYGALETAGILKNRTMIKYVMGRQCFPFYLSAIERDYQNIRSKNIHELIHKHVKAFGYKRILSIVVPLYNTPEDFFRDMLISVVKQTYQGFQLVLADASDEEKGEKLKEIAKVISKDHGCEFVEGNNSLWKGINRVQIKYISLAENKGISENTNAGIKESDGMFVSLLDHDDLLRENAVYEMVKKILLEVSEYIGREHALSEKDLVDIYNKFPDFVYSDELSFVGTCDCVQSIHLKPAFSPESLRSNNYICHFTAFKRELFDEVGGFREEFDGSQDFDLFLRLTRKAKKIKHIEDVLYFWRIHAGSMAAGAESKPYAIENGRRALEEALNNEDNDYSEVKVYSSEKHPSFYKAEYYLKANSSILVLVESKKLANLILSNTEWMEVEGLNHARVDVKVSDEELDFDNYEMVVLLRDGFKPLNVKWLFELVSPLCVKGNKICGGSTYSDRNGRAVISHAGMACFEIDARNVEASFGDSAATESFTKDVNFSDENETSEGSFEYKVRAIPMYVGNSINNPGYMNRCEFRQNVAALNGAALAIKIDEKTLISKVDKLFSLNTWIQLCLENSLMGGYNVFTPYSIFKCDWNSRAKERYVKLEVDRFKGLFKKEGALDEDFEDRAFTNKWMKVFKKYYM